MNQWSSTRNKKRLFKPNEMWIYWKKGVIISGIVTRSCFFIGGFWDDGTAWFVIEQNGHITCLFSSSFHQWIGIITEGCWLVHSNTILRLETKKIKKRCRFKIFIIYNVKNWYRREGLKWVWIIWVKLNLTFYRFELVECYLSMQI